MNLHLLALAGITLAYWFVAFMVGGALTIGDCFENKACFAAKERDLNLADRRAASLSGDRCCGGMAHVSAALRVMGNSLGWG